jgi:hypothetical protein
VSLLEVGARWSLRSGANEITFKHVPGKMYDNLKLCNAFWRSVYVTLYTICILRLEFHHLKYCVPCGDTGRFMLKRNFLALTNMWLLVFAQYANICEEKQTGEKNMSQKTCHFGDRTEAIRLITGCSVARFGEVWSTSRIENVRNCIGLAV